MPRDISDIMRRYDELTPDGQRIMFVCLQLIIGETPKDRLSVLNLNRRLIKSQRDGRPIPDGAMPMVATAALNIIDGVADLADRRVLMSYYWHAEDVQGKKVPDVLQRNGFKPA